MADSLPLYGRTQARSCRDYDASQRRPACFRSCRRAIPTARGDGKQPRIPLHIRRFADAGGRDCEAAQHGGAAPAASDADGFFTLAPDLLCILGGDNRIRRANPAWQTLLGLAPDGLAGRAFVELLDPPDRPRIVAALGGAAPAFNLEAAALAAGGPPRPVRWAGAADPRTGAWHVIGRPADRTSEPHGTDLEAETAGALVLEVSPCPSCICAPDGRVLRANAVLTGLLGFDAAEPTARRLPDLVHPQDRGLMADAMARLATGRAAAGIVTRCATAGGGWCWLSWSLAARAGLIYAAATDLTARIAAEQGMIERELRLGALASTLPGAIYRIRQAPDGTRTVLFISDGERRLSGLDPAELAAAPHRLGEATHPDDADWVTAELARAGPAGGSTDLTYRIVPRGGGLRWVRDLGRAWPLRGGGVLWDGIRLDVTGWKEAEHGLRTARDLAEVANRAKSEFLANMSHELRTPLNAILGFTDLMLSETHGPIDNAHYREYLSDIHDSGAHLLALIGDILDMAKVDSGTYRLHEADVGLAAMAAGVLRLFREQARELGLTLVLDMPEGLPAVRADPRLLRQVLTNLLSNAVKFTPAGSVTVAAAVDAAGAVRLAVRDSGIGMTAAEIHTALTPFGQVESTMARHRPGTGLGLPLVKAFTELHDGRLDITSTPRQGTTVTVILPPERVVRG
jgi:signal transduction histidine kinase